MRYADSMNTLMPTPIPSRPPQSVPAPASGRMLLLISPSSTLPALFEMVARLAQQNSLFILDGGNTFQGYTLSAVLRRQRIDINDALRRVTLSRAFTCYQVAALLDEHHFTSGEPVLVLDFLSTFYDQGVYTADRCRLLKGCIRRLQLLSRSAPVAVWVRQRAVVPEEGLSFLESLQRAAGQVWTPARPPVLPIMRQPALF